MATYQSGLLGDFYRRQSQRRALTGLPSSYQEQRGAIDPMLAYDAQKTHEAGLLSQQALQFDRQMSLQEKARKDQATAGIVGGVGQLAMLPLAYGAGKNLGWWGTKTPPVNSAATPSTLPQITTNYDANGIATPGLLSGTGAQATVAPAAAATPAQAPLLAGTSYASAPEMAATTGQSAWAEPAAATTSGGELLGSVSQYGPPAIGGLLGGKLGSSLAMKYSPIGGQQEKKIGGGILGGAVTGAAIGSVGGAAGSLVGAVIGGIIGGISSLF